MKINLLKYDMIQWIIGLNAENLAQLLEFRNRLEREPLKPFTKAELVERAQMANRDIEEGRVIDLEELEKCYV